MPAQGGCWGRFLEQRARQLQRQVQHFRGARTGRRRMWQVSASAAGTPEPTASGRAVVLPQPAAGLEAQSQWDRGAHDPPSSGRSQLRRGSSNLRTLSLFRYLSQSASKRLPRTVHLDVGRTRTGAIMALAVCSGQCGPKGGRDKRPEPCSRVRREVSARYELEKQKRKMLHNCLVVSSIHGSGSEKGGGKGDLCERLCKDRRANEAGTVPGRAVGAEPVSPGSWRTPRGSRRLSADVPDDVLLPSGPVSDGSALPPELKGNIRVHCRIRPLLLFDKEFDDPASQDRPSWTRVVFVLTPLWSEFEASPASYYMQGKGYRVYGPAESQQVVFGDVCPLLTSLLDGYNVCILPYGQTGCGKSYTMLGPRSKEPRVPPWGPHRDLGIMPRAAGELFRLISENPSKSLKVDVSIVEVYNNDILELLAKERRTAVSGPKRDVRTSKAAKREVSPPTQQPIHSAEDFIVLAARSLQLRVQLATQVHACSSRSHLVITASLTAASPCGSPASPGSPGAQRPAEQVHAKLQLVDLAGSECVGVSGVTGSALRETLFINRRLAALADVLGALSERRGHIPYRNSQLTHLLQDVLGGDAKLLVILCVSPCQTHVAETLRCLGFGARVRQVQRGQAGGGSAGPRKPR
uniref:kinesin-like protein KIF25 n=1 Tax=Odobenus rosmarus divergens TaxID=9708 RepID=UPI00063C9480|nr:PREDICTED: kinesin-like protein KIF25 [Odobenus rosmarus divergens]